MLADEFRSWASHPKRSAGARRIRYVDDVDAVATRAVAAGATVLRPITNEFYGDRAGKLRDPFGHEWQIATRIEDVSPEEMQARAAKLYGKP